MNYRMMKGITEWYVLQGLDSGISRDDRKAMRCDKRDVAWMRG